jgi:peptidoglycan hydrolase-like protein with peptidoglycan-binding domain
MSMHLGEAQISEGALGSDVTRLQQILTGQGYNTGGITGIWGPETTTAVQAFQAEHELMPDGIAGPLTWAALNGNMTPAPVQVVPPTPAPVAPRPATGMFMGLPPMAVTVLLGMVGLALVNKK